MKNTIRFFFVFLMVCAAGMNAFAQNSSMAVKYTKGLFSNAPSALPVNIEYQATFWVPPPGHPSTVTGVPGAQTINNGQTYTFASNTSGNPTYFLTKLSFTTPNYSFSINSSEIDDIDMGMPVSRTDPMSNVTYSISSTGSGTAHEYTISAF